MTTKEQQTVDTLFNAIQELRTENGKFREDVKQQVETINTKTNTKHLPISLENEILKITQTSINDCIQKALLNYESPLVKLVKSVIDENSVELRRIISDSFTQVIGTTEFKQSIVNAFSHKVARTIISNNDGLFDKVSNELKQDSVFKAKMALAVANVVEECLSDRPV